MHTSFIGAHFTGKQTLFDAHFTATTTSFSGARFTGELTSFSGARFTGEFTSFSGARFTGEFTSFSGARFTGGQNSFSRADFGSCTVDFSNPAEWKNVNFDWDEDLSQKPGNVLPAEWPPTVVEVVDDPDAD